MHQTKNALLKLSAPFRRFVQSETSGGVLLLICTIIALIAANSRWSEFYENLWKLELGARFFNLHLTHSLQHWINDGLMTLFFFVVGLEIKRELTTGELKNPRVALLPLLAAIGGMVVPALIYVFTLGNNDGARGWGIPMATDIAFVVGFLSILGKRVPHGLKIFILSLAIVDDIGAILVIAIAYSSEISIFALVCVLIGIGIIKLLNRIGVTQIPVYVVVGVLIWLAFSKSGIHPTIAGVILGLLAPAVSTVTDKGPPLVKLERTLHPWVVYLIMPLFALANAGVAIDVQNIFSPVAEAVSYGLIVGKPVGILLFTWLAVKYLGGALPPFVDWKIMSGGGILAGIGFTMSLFIAHLALEDIFLEQGKIGILVGSLVSTLLGLLFLYIVLPRAQTKEN